MKVLHVYSGNLYGGVERFLATLARERAAAPEMEPAFALCFEGALARELRESGVPVEILGATRASRPWTVFAAAAALRRRIDRDRPDVALFHSAWPLALLGGAAPPPRALFLHNPVSPHWTTALARRRRPGLVLCNSDFVAATARGPFAGAWVRTCPLTVTPPPLPANFDRAALRRSLGVQDPAEVVVLLAARVERCKGHPLLLAALARLGAGTPWRCWIAGGPQRPSEHAYLRELQALACAPGLSGRVHFLGQRGDVPQLMAAADILCQPNESPDSFGLAFVEAMYSGLPVVTTALGGALEVVPPSAGLLVPPDAAALAGALASLIASAERRAELGAAGARHALAFAPARRLPGLAAELAAFCNLPRSAAAGYPPR